MYISSALSIVHTTSTSSRLSCHHMPPIVLYFCKSICYSYHKVLLLSHLCSEKFRHSAHTHNAADPVHRYYSPENIWGSARENWAYVIFNISSIHLAVSLRPLKLCPSNLLHILPDHFTTAFCCRMFFIYSLGGPHD